MNRGLEVGTISLFMIQVLSLGLSEAIIADHTVPQVETIHLGI